MKKLTKGQIEILTEMQKTNRSTIYIGTLGYEGLGKFGMSVTFKIRRGTARAFINAGLAEEINSSVVKLNELGKNYGK